ncbi:hypothetical protein OIK40_03080 [Erythrobacter sp. sf7]|uniref:Uncharacterized protein n=1 Tax=Erythrobacter fulvus TaxID=2987523 RepID=A0ABT5JLX7_9SPHN|nr:hypothetical protein [Erythrobacter fulvus]
MPLKSAGLKIALAAKVIAMLEAEILAVGLMLPVGIKNCATGETAASPLSIEAFC